MGARRQGALAPQLPRATRSSEFPWEHLDRSQSFVDCTAPKIHANDRIELDEFELSKNVSSTYTLFCSWIPPKFLWKIDLGCFFPWKNRVEPAQLDF